MAGISDLTVAKGSSASSSGSGGHGGSGGEASVSSSTASASAGTGGAATSSSASSSSASASSSSSASASTGTGGVCSSDDQCDHTNPCAPYVCSNGGCVLQTGTDNLACTACDDSKVITGHCSGGVCQGTLSADCQLFACDPATKTCFSGSCTSSDQCAASAFCAPGPKTCVGCGSVSDACTSKCSSPAQGAPAGTCQGSVCTVDCSASNCASPFDTMDSAYRLECTGSACNDMTIACHGPRACRVVCSGGACHNLKLSCPEDGLCDLSCDGAGSCVGATMTCGNGPCTSSCTNGAAPTIDCASACSCAKNGC